MYVGYGYDGHGGKGSVSDIEALRRGGQVLDYGALLFSVFFSGLVFGGDV